jgi:hypothetical protein
VNGRRPPGSNGHNGHGHDPHGHHDRAGTDGLYEDISAIQNRLGGLIGELDRRRHDVMDVKTQARRHLLSFVLVGVAAVGAVAGLIAWRVSEGRRRGRFVARVRGLRAVLGRVVRDPERMAQRQPRIATRLLVASGEATAGLVAKRLAERLLAAGH